MEHKYLKYEKVILNYIFSFSWDVVRYSYKQIRESLMSNNEQANHWKWTDFPLHKRPLWWIDDNKSASYHPNIESENLQTICSREIIDNDITIVYPLKKDEQNILGRIIGELRYNIRIFENGTGTFTFAFKLDDEELKSDSSDVFRKIMLSQHLATSITTYNSDNLKDEVDDNHLTNSYIELNDIIREKYHIKTSDKKLLLGNLFSCITNHYIELSKFILDDKEAVTKQNTNKLPLKNWQNPYIVTILQVNKNSLERLVHHQEPNIIKEIGAMAVRLTLDNNIPTEDYQNILRREYVYRSLGFYVNPKEDFDPEDSLNDEINISKENKKHPRKIRLRNYSHSNNLFYTYGRRAGIAVTSDFDSHPAYFAIPTFVNILEILRSRWHLGTITNLLLDETFEKVAHNQNIDELVNEIFKCRVLYGLFLQNPTPYLFDSGAVTEIADTADTVFWLSKIKVELESKLIALDRLVEVIYAKQRLQKYSVNG